MDFFSYIVFFCTLQDLSTCNHVCVCFGYMYEKEVKINRKQYINSNGDSFPYIKKNKKSLVYWTIVGVFSGVYFCKRTLSPIIIE